MHQVFAMLGQRDITIAVARANAQLPTLLQHYGLLKFIGEHRLYPTNRHAVAAFRQECEQRMSEPRSARVGC